MSFQDLLIETLLPNLGSTILMVMISSILSTILGLAIAIILVITNKRGLKPHPIIYTIFGIIVNLIRSFPFIILMIALIPATRILVGTSIGISAALVPLTFAMTPYIARLFENNLLAVSPVVIQAALSFGASTRQIIFKVMIVEALPNMISSLTLAMISVLGYTAMAGTIGAGGLGAVAITYGYENFDNTVMYSTVIVLIVLVQAIQWIGSYSYKKFKIT